MVSWDPTLLNVQNIGLTITGGMTVLAIGQFAHESLAPDCKLMMMMMVTTTTTRRRSRRRGKGRRKRKKARRRRGAGGKRRWGTKPKRSVVDVL